MMKELLFSTEDGLDVPAVTAAEMREVDRLAVEELGLQILQMMENAGRNLCELILQTFGASAGRIVVCAGAGGNGGGGLSCVRHLHNRGARVAFLLDREVASLHGPASAQARILRGAGIIPEPPEQARRLIADAPVVVDALIGYSLQGPPRGRTEELIELCNGVAANVVSLDVPSGLDATTGAAPGIRVRPARVMTLALPKTGLTALDAEIFLADIGIPPELYAGLGISVGPLFGPRYRVRIVPRSTWTPQGVPA
jgi:NAD(P)H-hydrate epimerase